MATQPPSFEPGPGPEKRVTAGHYELRKGPDGAQRLLGYPVVFNQRSEDFGGWVEVVAPGAFDQSMKTRSVFAFFNHDPSRVLGRTDAGTVSYTSDATGLAMDLLVPDTSYGRDLLVSVERGDVRGGSFLFNVFPDGATWSEDPSGLWVRTLRNCILYEAGPVTMPAYPDTSVAVRELRSLQARIAPEIRIDPAIAARARSRRLELLARS